MEGLSGRAALVTGASGGIGSCIARRLSQDGVRLALCGRNGEKLQETASSLSPGTEVLLLEGDLLDDEFLLSCPARVKERFGQLDILVNCAGMALSRSFSETSASEYDRIMALNARAPFLLMQAALPFLLASDRAEIVNIASVCAEKGYPLQSAYSASKHALAGMSKSLAAEVYDKGVRVHLISPGGVFTDMVRIARPDLQPDGMILPEDVAEIAAFLLERRTNAVIDQIAVHRPGKQPYL
jgi:3-oxoacyl-[acyl-carrier protein] reductase